MKKAYHIVAKRVPESVILTGDPERARLLSGLLDRKKLINKARGLYVYKGYYKDLEVAISVHGIGGPSTAITLEELIRLGGKRFIRIGSAGSLREDLKPGEIVVPSGVGYFNNSSLGMYVKDFCFPASPNLDLTVGIERHLKEKGYPFVRGPIFSSDSFYAEEKYIDRLRKAGFIAVEMECSTILVLSQMRGARSSCLLLVSNYAHKKEGIELSKKFLEMGTIALDTLIETKN